MMMTIGWLIKEWDEIASKVIEEWDEIASFLMFALLEHFPGYIFPIGSRKRKGA
jgi:putative Mn2+ efflux pump MntP